MAVTGPSTLVPTIDDFLQHWALADDCNAPDHPLEVLQNLRRNDLLALRDLLERGPAAVESALDQESTAREKFDARLKQLASAMKKYHGLIRGNFPRFRWERLLTPLPGPMARVAIWRPSFWHTLFCWRKAAAILPESGTIYHGSESRYAAEDFAIDLGQLEAAYLTLLECQAETALAKAEWDIWNEQTMEMMKAYGHAIKARFGSSSTQADTLPQLWPGPKRGDRRKTTSNTRFDT